MLNLNLCARYNKLAKTYFFKPFSENKISKTINLNCIWEITSSDKALCITKRDIYEKGLLHYSKTFTVKSKFFPVSCLFAPKVQKGIDKGKKSTRFRERCIVDWKYTWAPKSPGSEIASMRVHFAKIMHVYVWRWERISLMKNYYCRKLPICAFTALPGDAIWPEVPRQLLP